MPLVESTAEVRCVLLKSPRRPVLVSLGCLTIYHRLGDLTNTCLFLTILEIGEGPLAENDFLLCSHMATNLPHSLPLLCPEDMLFPLLRIPPLVCLPRNHQRPLPFRCHHLSGVSLPSAGQARCCCIIHPSVASHTAPKSMFSPLSNGLQDYPPAQSLDIADHGNNNNNSFSFVSKNCQ